MNWNKYRISSICALLATIAIALAVGLSEEPYNQISGRAILLLTFVPVALLFSPAVWVLIKGYDVDNHSRRGLDAADLFGAAVSMIGWAISIPYVRVVFFSGPGQCATGTTCYAWVLSIQLILASCACALLLVVFVVYFLHAKNQLRTYIMLSMAIALSVAAFWYGLTHIAA